MGRKCIKATAPLTDAERQKRYRDKKNIETYAQRKYDLLYEEMKKILDGLSNSELCAIAPIMRYMELSKKELGKERNNRGKDLDDLFIDFCASDIEPLPEAEFNLPTEDLEKFVS
jgi:uncharacterized protein YfbU (UPF0304 family)